MQKDPCYNGIVDERQWRWLWLGLSIGVDYGQQNATTYQRPESYWAASYPSGSYDLCVRGYELFVDERDDDGDIVESDLVEAFFAEAR